MRKLILPILFLPIFSFAQREWKEWSIAGLIGASKNGYNAQLHGEYYFGEGGTANTVGLSFGQARLYYSDQNLPTAYDAKMSLKQYGLAILYGFSPEFFIKRPWYFSVSVGGYGGYDYANKGQEVFSPYEIPFDINYYNRIVYGVATGVQLEYNISEKFSVLADYAQVYRFNSNIGTLTYYGNIGLKYFLSK